MTVDEYKRLMREHGITSFNIAKQIGISNIGFWRRINEFDEMSLYARTRMEAALKELILDAKAKEISVYWRFTERNANAHLQRGVNGKSYSARWVPMTLYPIIQFVDDPLPRPPDDMRWALREVASDSETATQAFDRLIDTSTKPISWREEEPVRLAA